MEEQECPEPDEPDANLSAWKKKLAETEGNEWVKDMRKLKATRGQAMTLTWGQCSEAVRSKIEGTESHLEAVKETKLIDMLKMIRSVMFQFQSDKKLALTIMESKHRVVNCKQTAGQSLPAFYKTFKRHVAVAEHNGASYGCEKGLVALELENIGVAHEQATAEEMKGTCDRARQQMLAITFLSNSDQSRHGSCLRELQNSYSSTNDECPTTLEAAHTKLSNYTPPPTATTPQRSRQQQHDQRPPSGREVAFSQSGSVAPGTAVTMTLIAGTDGRTHGHVTCYGCNKRGHYESKCPDANNESAVQMLMHGECANFSFLNASVMSMPNEVIPSNWILLDTGSTINCFKDGQCLKNIRSIDSSVTVHCNAGDRTSNLVGDFPGFPEPVWCMPDGIANILSLAKVEEHYKVTYEERVFRVHKPDGSTRDFVRAANGLRYWDARNGIDQQDCALVTTVADKKANYTVNAYKRAQLARKIHEMIGPPSLADFLRIIDDNLILNCPITREDVVAAEDLFGPSVRCLQGKTTRRSGKAQVQLPTLIPPQIYDRFKHITLCIDIMFVNKHPFLVTTSRGIRFITAEYLPNRQADTVLEAIVRVKKIYNLRYFSVTHIVADSEFECLRADISDEHATLETVAEDEHVPEVERCIRTVKERCRALWSGLPFRTVPTRMLIEFILGCVTWLNMFPPSDGVSRTISPRAIITGIRADYKRHCRIEPGTYVQTHEEHDNTMAGRTLGAIALRPQGNAQGSYYFLNLRTGQRISRLRWNELPMPEEVINRVHVLARRNNAHRALTFAYGTGEEIFDDADDDDDSDYNPDDDPEEDLDLDDPPAAGALPAGVDNDNNNTNETDEENDDNEPIDAGADDNEQPPVEGHPMPDEQQQPTAVSDHSDHDDDQTTANPPDAEDGQNTGVDAEDGQNAGVEDAPDPVESAGVHDPIAEVPIATMDEICGPRVRDNMRPRRNRQYAGHKYANPRPASEHIAAQVQTPDNLLATTPEYMIPPTDYLTPAEQAEHVMMTQFSIKRGLKEFGEAGALAVIEEMKQLDVRDVMEPVQWESLTKEQKKASLEYLMFLKRKRCGRIKGRGCADGRKQRLYKTKHDTSSPTASTESLFLSCVIDALERRDVATIDIPGAFMQTDIDELTHVKLTGPLALLMVRVDPKYGKFIQCDKGTPVLCARLKKALYGTLQAALLFWKDLTGVLQEWGFTLNKYDSCVANATIEGSQCTILWHVDDLKISHINPDVVSDIIKRLNGRHGKEAPLTETRGEIHDYLGMTIDYSVDGKVIFRVDDYVAGILAEARDEAVMNGEAVDPAADHLFAVNEDNPDKLEPTDADHFHTMVAKLLFLSKRARPDIQQAVAFLTTRVSSPDTDDYKKLGRVIRYSRMYPDLPLTLEADGTNIIKWWIDASFAVHPDMRSHTGATMSMGKGSVYSASTRQKLNTKSSTEAELVAVDDVMPIILWTKYFLEEQGCAINDTTIYQDNQSAMLLEKNGRASSGRRTRHINIRYYFVTDRVKSGEVSIDYCPTETMTGDFFTKPLSGAKFRYFRRRIMNLPDDVLPQELVVVDRLPRDPSTGVC